MSTLGKPAPPNPEMNTVAPSPTSATASLAVLTRLSIGIELSRSSGRSRAPLQTRTEADAAPPNFPRGAWLLDLRIDQLDDAAHVKIAVSIRDMHGVGRRRRRPERRCRARHLRGGLRQT